MIPCPHFLIQRKRNPLTRRWRYWVVLVAENCEVLSTSEMLSSDHAAMTNIESQMANAPQAEVVRDYEQA